MSIQVGAGLQLIPGLLAPEAKGGGARLSDAWAGPEPVSPKEPT